MNFTTSSASALIGTPGSPASLAVSTSASGSLALRTSNTASNNLGGGIFGAVIVGSSIPTTNPTVQFSYTVDGTNYLSDGGPYVVPMATGTYAFRYSLADAPPEAVGLQVTVTNGTGYAITHWWQGVTESLT